MTEGHRDPGSAPAPAAGPGAAVPRPGKVVLIVCDSLGVGEAPDAGDYGDRGADTVGHAATATAVPSARVAAVVAIVPEHPGLAGFDVIGPFVLAAQLAVLELSLADHGYPVQLGAGVGAAMAALDGSEMAALSAERRRNLGKEDYARDH